MYNGDITIKSCAAISCEYIHAYIYKYPTSSQIPARKLEICDLGVFPWFSVCFPWSPPTKKKLMSLSQELTVGSCQAFPKRKFMNFPTPVVQVLCSFWRASAVCFFPGGQVRWWSMDGSMDKMDQAESEATQSSVKFPDFTGGLGPLAPPSNR